MDKTKSDREALAFDLTNKVDLSVSPCRVQMCFIWNSQQVGGVVLLLRSLVSTDNMVDDIPYFPACPKFSDKWWNKLHKT